MLKTVKKKFSIFFNYFVSYYLSSHNKYLQSVTNNFTSIQKNPASKQISDPFTVIIH